MPADEEHEVTAERRKLIDRWRTAEGNSARAALVSAVRGGRGLPRAQLDRLARGRTRTPFRTTDMRLINLAGQNLDGADFSGANLQEANLARASLRNANLSGANLRGALLRNTDLTGADLTGADLRGAFVENAILTGAILTDVRADRAVIFGAPRLRSGTDAEHENAWLRVSDKLVPTDLQRDLEED